MELSCGFANRYGKIKIKNEAFNLKLLNAKDTDEIDRFSEALSEFLRPMQLTKKIVTNIVLILMFSLKDCSCFYEKLHSYHYEIAGAIERELKGEVMHEIVYFDLILEEENDNLILNMVQLPSSSDDREMFVS